MNEKRPADLAKGMGKILTSIPQKSKPQPLFFIGYDLRENNGKRDYTPIEKALEKLGAIRLLKSDWCLHSPAATAESLRTHLEQFIETGDGIWVAQSVNWTMTGTQATPDAV